MSTELVYIRSSTDAQRFYEGIDGLLRAAFPERILSVYLLSSRADGSAIPTSDVDLALVFRGRLDPAERGAIKTVLSAITRVSPVMIDVTVTSEEEIRGGITTSMQHNRLVSGPDILKDQPLKPKADLLLYYAGFAMHFIQVVRNERGALRFPLGYPRDAEGFCGYEIYGTRVEEGHYAPGLNLLGTLVSSIASFRLAAKADVFSPGKSRTLALYEQHLPNDPWLPMIAELRSLIRGKLGGKIPPPGTDRDRLSYWCPRVLDLENEFLSDVIMAIEGWLPLQDPDYRRQLVAFVHSLQCTSATHAAQLSRLKTLLPRSPA